MNKNYYTDEYYNNQKAKYALNYFDRDIGEALLYAYASFCGLSLVDGEETKIPVITFIGMSYLYLGKSLYDLCKISYIDNKQKNGEGLTKPLKLKRIKEYK